MTQTTRLHVTDIKTTKSIRFKVHFGQSILGLFAADWQRNGRGRWRYFSDPNTPPELADYLNPNPHPKACGPFSQYLQLPHELGPTLDNLKAVAFGVTWPRQPKTSLQAGYITIDVTTYRPKRSKDPDTYHVSLDSEQGMWDVASYIATLEEAIAIAKEEANDWGATPDIDNQALFEVWTTGAHEKNALFAISAGYDNPCPLCGEQRNEFDSQDGPCQECVAFHACTACGQPINDDGDYDTGIGAYHFTCAEKAGIYTYKTAGLT